MGGYHFEPLREQPQEKKRVVAWLQEAFFGPQGMGLEATEERLAVRMGAAPLPQIWVVLEGGEAVGTVSLELGEHPTIAGLRCCLAGLYVAPEKRGRGIGEWLCTQAQKEAAKMGYPSLTLYTPKAEGYYHRLGWKTTMYAALSTEHGLEWCAVMESPGGR